jgi:alkylhydroperoxidase family enzyme
VRIHVDRALAAGVSADEIAQLAVWRDSGVFTDRERAAFELTEAFTFISEEGVPDEVYDHVGGILSEQEYVGLSWILVAINAFNRVAIAGRYPVPPRTVAS